MLRSIPPANRQPPRRTGFMPIVPGFTISGGPTRPVVNTSEAPYQPRVVRPNPQKEKQRQTFYAALNKKIEGIRELLALATEPGETLFWQRELDRLKGL